MTYSFARMAALMFSLSLAAPALAQAPTQAPAQAPQTGAATDPVVAKVDGAEIKLSDVEEARTMLPDQYRSLPLPMVFDPLVDALIDMKLSATAARKQGLLETDEVKRSLKQTEDRVLQQALMRREIDKTLTEEKVKARYDELAAGMEGQEQVKARHILVKTKDEADAVVKDLKAGGDFQKLARERSQDPSAGSGGDLGYFSREEMVQPFSEAAFALQPGSYTETPVETQFGWHVIMVEDKRADAVESFESVRDQLREEMTREVVASAMKDLRAQADIKRFAIDGSPM